ncbi:alpha/beta fold hydrolase [Staphylococcus sp. 30400_3112M30941]|nr:alpha/beta fold hydrolase [Staphylococcus sp. 30403_3112M30944]MBO0944851.1 alpha/beta fold hydrolase [Staphylococcus sp. 30402_3112M30943]MBO0964189.1 alpha/beta fold hydrolase [Staphylococcus sp. 30400_3112M30941]MBO0966017.1 alpha/beta fold hydrolase [Staphylococcus sp. 30401_3112M30942]
MNTLKLKDATLKYTTLGEGPILILIPGANGTGDIFRLFAEALKEHFTVVTYDRRGYGESTLTHPLPTRASNAYDDYRIKRDALDIAELATQLSPDPVYVFGTSSGAIVGMHLLKEYPDTVKKVALHEPPINTFLPDSTNWKKKNENIVSDILNKGLEEGMKTFSKKNNASSDDLNTLSQYSTNKSEVEKHKYNQTLYWAKYEIRQYTHSNITLDDLNKNKSKITLLSGLDSKGNFVYNVNQYISNYIDIDVIHMPDGHFGYLKKPKDFSTILLENWGFLS